MLRTDGFCRAGEATAGTGVSMALWGGGAGQVTQEILRRPAALRFNDKERARCNGGMSEGFS